MLAVTLTTVAPAPNPADPGADAAVARRNLRHCDTPIGDALLDGRVVVGVAPREAVETLATVGGDPATPAALLLAVA